MSFSEQIKNFTLKTEATLDRVVKNIVADIADELIFRTPVDTGRARANWVLGVNQINSSVFLNSFDADGYATSNKIRSMIPDIALGNVYYITNSLPYVKELENGKSRQAPTGMVKITRLRFNGIIKRSLHVY